MAGRGDRWWPPPSRPLPADGGIRSRSRRGSFAESWWGERWIEVLEGFRIGKRLGRGRSYARKGQVLEIEIEPGAAGARVQGSRSEPYRVRIALGPLDALERRTVAEELTRRSRLAASLLAGEMPREIEDAFAKVGVPLFPERQGDLTTDCTCPDWSNPCKHIAAVYYLMAEELDRNPFLLLRLRGFRRADLVEATGKEGDGGGASVRKAEDDRKPEPRDTNGPPATHDEKRRAPEDPRRGRGAALPTDPALFWRAGVDAEESQREASPALLELDPEKTPAAHLRALSRVPFWRGEADPEAALEEMTRRGAALARAILAGEDGIGGWDGDDPEET